VKNQSSDTFNTDDVVLVLDGITDLAGKDALDRLEVVSATGDHGRKSVLSDPKAQRQKAAASRR
jgi:hypothetical protein